MKTFDKNNNVTLDQSINICDMGIKYLNGSGVPVNYPAAKNNFYDYFLAKNV